MARLRRKNLPNETRRALALRYECKPGSTTQVSCHWCGKLADVIWYLLASGKPHHWPIFGHHIDHLLPRARGGADQLSNLVLSCEHCNKSRCARTEEEYRRLVA